ncbi:MAG: CoA pyrophosphatase [Lysobacterales bacterium]
MSEENDWLRLLKEAVSPLESGVRELRVTGYRPPDVPSCRPSRTAAVLVPVLDLPEPEIVLTRRADHLPQHPGQVSFPGGAAEEDDNSAVETALREAFEEIGLPPDAARPIGFLDRMDTISDYRVLPVVALVKSQPPVKWVLERGEVAEVFTVPFSVALDARRYVSYELDRQGPAARRVWSMDWNGQRIWGATAAMLMNLIERMERIRERQTTAVGDRT